MNARELKEQMGSASPVWIDEEARREEGRERIDQARRELTDRDGASGWLVTFLGCPALVYGLHRADWDWWWAPLLLIPVAAWRWVRHGVWFWRCPSCQRLTMRQVFQSSHYSVGAYPYAHYHDTLDKCRACGFERERKQLAETGGDW